MLLGGLVHEDAGKALANHNHVRNEWENETA